MVEETSTTENTQERKTLKDRLLALGRAALVVLFTLLLIEIILRVLDPWGMSYFNDLETMGNDIFTSDPIRGFYMPDGQYKFSYWTSTIENGTRIVPDTNPDADCEIIILGDSVAHGYGVDDDEVWVNQVAQQLPDVHILNTGIPRYNSTNVLGSFQTYPNGDAYLYLIIQNDIDVAVNVDTQSFVGSGSSLPQILRYANLATYGGASSFTDVPEDQAAVLERLRDDSRVQRFLEELRLLAADERVTLAAFSHETLTQLLLELDEFDLNVLAYPPYRISYSDYHLNAEGNGELADEMLPIIQQMSAEHCGTGE